MSQVEPPIADFLTALDHLDAALDEGLHQTYIMRQRIREIRENYYAQGVPIQRVVDSIDGDRPMAHVPLIRTLNEFLDTLISAGAEIRRAEARVLYAEQMSMDQIAQIFGISRQRVSKLLQSNP